MGRHQAAEESAFAGASVFGRRNPSYTGAVPAQASQIRDVTSWVPDLPKLRGSESRAPDLGDNGSLSVGPHEGVKAQPKAETSDVHTVPMPSSGFSGLLINGSEPGYPDLVEGRNGGRFEGKESEWSTETTRRVGAQKTPTMGSSGKATDGEYDPADPFISACCAEGFEGWISSLS